MSLTQFISNFYFKLIYQIFIKNNILISLKYVSGRNLCPKTIKLSGFVYFHLPTIYKDIVIKVKKYFDSLIRAIGRWVGSKGF